MTKVTAQTRDRRIDIIASMDSVIGMNRLIIRCKHYPGGTVGEAEVRDLIGAWQEHREATRAVFVTSGRFSDRAVRLAERNRINLEDGLTLARMLRQYRSPSKGAFQR